MLGLGLCFSFHVIVQMLVFDFMKSVIKSAARLARRGQNRPLFRCFPLFIPISKVLSSGLFQSFPETDQSLSPPHPPRKPYQRPLIVTLFICAHSEAAKQCDKWALPCAKARVEGVCLFMEIEGGLYVFSPQFLRPVYIDTWSQNNMYSTGRWATVFREHREVTCCAE